MLAAAAVAAARASGWQRRRRPDIIAASILATPTHTPLRLCHHPFHSLLRHQTFVPTSAWVVGIGHVFGPHPRQRFTTASSTPPPPRGPDSKDKRDNMPSAA